MYTSAGRLTRVTALALVAALGTTPLMAQTPGASTAPGVAILDFNNGALARDMDYAPLGKGIADMLITELAANRSIRLVEREQLQKILQEHDLVTAGRVDNANAVRAGRLVGARYFLKGGFVVDTRQQMTLTVQAVNTETSELEWSDKVEGKSEDVFRLIAELGRKINTGLKLPQFAAGRPGDAAATPAATPANRRQVSAQDQYRAFYLVSRSIEEQDKKNYTAAISLLRQALDVYPGYERAQTRLASLQRGGSERE
jgi:TolB-like protein